MTWTISKTWRASAVHTSSSFDPRDRRARLMGSSALAAGALRELALAAGVTIGVALGGGYASAADYAAGGGVNNAPSGYATAVGDSATTNGPDATALGS